MNIIFILLDDLGWNDVGVHNKNIKTPNICNLANHSCELKRNYTFSVCGPTRAMVQTGIYAYKYGMQRLIPAYGYFGLDKNLKIIPQYLKEIGYKNYAIGKWHLGHNNKKWQPHQRGYDYHYGNLTGCINHYNHKNCETNIHDLSENAKPIYEQGHACDLITNKALDVIEKNKENKFFIYLAFNSPHLPHQVEQKYKDIYPNETEQKKAYYGMISHVDYNLGLIFQKLKDLNIYDDTLIWLQSDNGGWIPDWACGDNYPLKNGKASFYDGGIRVFSLIKHKEIKIKSFEGFSHSVDILPTLLDFAEYKKQLDNIDGITIKKDLINNTQIKRNIILNFYNENMWSFISGNFKIINQNNVIEIYDLINDQQEKNNLFKNKYEEFKEEIDNFIKNCKSNHVKDLILYLPEKEAKKKCENIKYWGQQVKGWIKIQNVSENKNCDSFLKMSGYDIFYDN